MGQEKLDTIVETMKRFEKNQKNMEKRITKLTEICRDRFKKVEKEFNDKYQAQEKKLVAHDEEVLNLKNEEVKISDNISVLEAEHDVIADRIKVIDDALEAMNTNIDELKNKLDVTDVRKETENDKKQCRFDNLGYCRENNDCPFYHADSICTVYLSNGICWKRECRDRHPKLCRYYDECFRGSSCRYLHRSHACQRCKTFSVTSYFCEFCTQSFCQQCTIEKAHLENIYDDKTSDEKADCHLLHKSMVWSA